MSWVEFLAPIVYAAIVIGCVVNCAHIIVREGTDIYQDLFEIVLTHLATIAGIIIVSEIFP